MNLILESGNKAGKFVMLAPTADPYLQLPNKKKKKAHTPVSSMLGGSPIFTVPSSMNTEKKRPQRAPQRGERRVKVEITGTHCYFLRAPRLVSLRIKLGRGVGEPLNWGPQKSGDRTLMRDWVRTLGRKGNGTKRPAETASFLHTLFLLGCRRCF